MNNTNELNICFLYEFEKKNEIWWFGLNENKVLNIFLFIWIQFIFVFYLVNEK